MGTYKVTLAISRGALFDTGRRIVRTVLAASMLDAALQAEHSVDSTLSNPAIEYSHTRKVKVIREPMPAPAMAMALAA